MDVYQVLVSAETAAVIAKNQVAGHKESLKELDESIRERESRLLQLAAERDVLVKVSESNHSRTLY